MSKVRVQKVRKSFAWLLVLLIAVISSLVPITGVYAATGYYVDGTNGNDSNNGTSISTAFKTIQKAASVAQAGDTVYIRGGVYRETITPVNSGTSASKIRFTNYNGESVTVSGCDLLTSWTQYSGNIYYTTMNWDMYNGDGNIVFCDGALMKEASWPNITDPLDRNQYAVIDSAVYSPFSLTDSALIGNDNDWNGALLWTTTGNGYSSFTARVTGYTSASKTLSFDWPLSTEGYYPKTGCMYYITRTLKALDVETEWYKDVANNRLYFYAPGGGSPSTRMVEAKKRGDAFDLSNKSNIEIEGINLRGAGINFTGSSYCTLKKSVVTAVDYNNPYMLNGNEGPTTGLNLDGDHNTVRDSEIKNMFGPGILVKGHDNNVINNYIHDIDYLHNYADGIRIFGYNQLISHNTLYKAARSLIGGSFSSSVIQYNNCYDAMRISADGGLFYLCNYDYGNSEIHHNWFHENSHGEGIYLDNHSHDAVVYDNVVWNTSGVSIRANVPNEYCLYYNNSCYNTGRFIQWGPVNESIGTRLINNIFRGTVLYLNNDIYSSNNIINTDPGWVNPASADFHLQSTAAARNAGTVLPGVTDGYEGTAPDIGAYEYGGNWTSGHNFTTPPNPTLQFNANIPYRNLVYNAGFEFEKGSMSGWTSAAGSPSIVQQNAWGYAMTSLAKSNNNGVALKAGDRIEQTITGLQPNTTYTMTGWGRIHGPILQAENYNNKSGNFQDDVGSLSLIRDGEWIEFDNFNFGSGSPLYNYIAAGMFYSISGTSMEIWIDSPTSGTKIGTLSITGNGNNGLSWQEISISAVTGIHDVYFVFKGAGSIETGSICNLDALKFRNSTMNDDVIMGVKNYGGTAVTSIITSQEWDNIAKEITFTTGPSNTSATIYADKPDGAYLAYVDSFGLVNALPKDSFSMSEGFENGFTGWTAGGTATTSTVQHHEGTKSYVTDQDIDYITKTLSTGHNKNGSVWFYDDAADTSLSAFAFMDDGVGAPSTVAIGVSTTTSASKYCYRFGSTYTATNITRTTGWHKFEFDYSSGTKVILRIDGITVAISNNCTTLKRIVLGDWWSDSKTGTVYFDDLAVNDSKVAYLSDMNWSSATGGYPPPYIDADRDGGTINMEGTTYLKGIGVRAISDITYDLPVNTFGRFQSYIGIDDDVGSLGTIVFKVYADGVLKYDSATMTGATATKFVDIDITGVSQLKLSISDAGDGNSNDDGNWADAKLILK